MRAVDSTSSTRQKVACELVRHFEQTKDSPRLSLARLIEVRTREPQVFVTVLGETSSGKSTLINALVGSTILPVSAAPSSGAVTHVIVHDKPETNYFAIYSDATQEGISQDDFRRLSLKPPEELLRLQVRISAQEKSHVGLQVFDTPGFNSLVSDHQEVLTRFIPESDAVVFVVDYPSGFGQPQQELLELLSSSLPADVKVPLILAINRVPTGCQPTDRRIVEIMGQASDCLNREPDSVLIECATLLDEDTEDPATPNADSLWSAVARIVVGEELQNDVLRKLDWLLKKLIQDAIEEYDRKEFELAATDLDREQILHQVSELRQARDRSRVVVRQTIRRLECKLPDILGRGCEQLKQEIDQEIDVADKWLDSRGCGEWIGIHKLPFGARNMAGQAENEIRADLERLNRELSDIANTAAQKIRDDVRIKSDAAEKFTENIAVAVSQRVAGTGITTLLRSFGGACGPAAGAGNLAKMVVSKSGKFIGKTFSREVHTAIGKAFTKKLLARLNVAVMVLIEVGSELVDIHRWQGKLKTKTAKAVDEWCEETVEDVLQNQLPEIEQRNLDGIAQIYDDLIVFEASTARENQKSLEDRLKTIRSWRDSLRGLAHNLPSES